MLILRPASLDCQRLFVVIMALCICVLMQLLGAPVTMLNAGDISDTVIGSVLEGFALPPTLPQLAFPSESTLVGQIQPFGHVSGFAVLPFHPPVR
ncbi:MAG TPA: hypothetical protein VH681_08625 [Nitrospiraceae bacterium]|jgi:hypothetical protein